MAKPKPKRKFQKSEPFKLAGACAFCFKSGAEHELEHKTLKIRFGNEQKPGKVKIHMGVRILSLPKMVATDEIPMRARACNACLPRAKSEGWTPRRGAGGKPSASPRAGRRSKTR